MAAVQCQGFKHEQDATLDMMIQRAESQITDEVYEKTRELASKDQNLKHAFNKPNSGNRFQHRDDDDDDHHHRVMMGFPGGARGQRMGGFQCGAVNMGVNHRHDDDDDDHHHHHRVMMGFPGGARGQRMGGFQGGAVNMGVNHRHDDDDDFQHQAMMGSPGNVAGGRIQAAGPGAVAVGGWGLKQVIVVGGTFNNKSKCSKTILSEKKWDGYFLPKYPSMFQNFTGFVHSGVAMWGAKAGVVYAGRNNAGAECGWLVAWSDSSKGTKVYAECGPKSKYQYVNWDQIKEKLKSSGSKVDYSDKQLGISVSAKIMGGWGKHGLAAVFSG